MNEVEAALAGLEASRSPSLAAGLPGGGSEGRSRSGGAAVSLRRGRLRGFPGCSADPPGCPVHASGGGARSGVRPSCPAPRPWEARGPPTRKRSNRAAQPPATPHPYPRRSRSRPVCHPSAAPCPRLRSFLTAGVILGVSVGLAYLLVSMAPEPARTEPPPQIPFAQTGRVVAGSGALPVLGGRHREAERGSTRCAAGGRPSRVGASGFPERGPCEVGTGALPHRGGGLPPPGAGSRGQSRRPARGTARRTGTGGDRPRPVRPLRRGARRRLFASGRPSPHPEGAPAEGGPCRPRAGRGEARRRRSRPLPDPGDGALRRLRCARSPSTWGRFSPPARPWGGSSPRTRWRWSSP